MPAATFTEILAGQLIAGAWLSFTVIVNEQVAVLPLASVTLNVFVVTPFGKVPPLAIPPVRLSVGPAQLSANVALEKLVVVVHRFAAVLSTWLPGQLIVGNCTSKTTILNEHVDILPTASDAW